MLHDKNKKFGTFIFFHEKEQPPTESEVPDRDILELHSPILSEREKLAVLKDYKKLKDRIEKAKELIIECAEIIELIPENDPAHKEAEKLYDQARKVLKGVINDLPKDLGDPEILNELITDLRQEDKKIFKEFLRNNQFNPAFVAISDKIFDIENDPTIVVDTYHELRTAGFPQEEINKIFFVSFDKPNGLASSAYDNTLKIGIEGLKLYMLNAKATGLSFDDMYRFWCTLDEKEIRTTIELLRNHGIQDHFYALYLISEQKDTSLAMALINIQILADVGYDRNKIIDVLEKYSHTKEENHHNNLVAYLFDAKKLGLTIEEAQDIFAFGGFNSLGEIKKIKEAGVNSNIANVFRIARSYLNNNDGWSPTVRQSINYKKIFELLKLQDYKLEDKDIFYASELEGPSEKILNYLENLLPLGYGTLGMLPLELICLYPIESDPQKVKNIADKVPEIHKTGINHFPACELALINEQISPENQVQLNSFITKNLQKGLDEEQIINIWTLYQGKTENIPKDLIQEIIDENNAVDKDEIMELEDGTKMAFVKKPDRPEKLIYNLTLITLPFIQTLLKNGFNAEKIQEHWKNTSSKPNEVISFIKFEKEWPDYISKFYNKSQRSIDKRDAAKFADSYYQQTNDAQIFLRHVMDGSGAVSSHTMQEFMKDPAINLALEVFKTMTTKDIEIALKVGRNLFLKNFFGTIDARIIEEEIIKIDKLNELTGDIKVFEGRNIIFLANGEKWDTYAKETDYRVAFLGIHQKNRFNTPEMRYDLLESRGSVGSAQFEAPSSEPTIEELNNVKERTLLGIANTPPPLTFMFNGHGGPYALYMNAGKIVNQTLEGKMADCINAEDIAKAIAQRKKNFPNQLAELKHDIYIFDSCYNHSFIRHLYSKIKELDGIAPITMGESEYGQLGFGLSASITNKFDASYRVLNLGKKGQRGTKIKDVRKNESASLFSNFTIYVPDEEGDPQQIVKKDSPPPNKEGG
ncbi:MAG: hypothetical protein AAB373_01210 [Patescibacteria group bacterium]